MKATQSRVARRAKGALRDFDSRYEWRDRATSGKLFFYSINISTDVMASSGDNYRHNFPGIFGRFRANAYRSVIKVRSVENDAPNNVNWKRVVYLIGFEFLNEYARVICLASACELCS